MGGAIGLLLWRIRTGREPTVRLAAIVVVLLFVLSGAFSATRHIPIDAAYVQVAYVLGALFGATAKGSIAALLIWLVSLGGEKLRLKKRHEIPYWIGTILYWLGCAVGLYLLCVSIYLAVQALGGDEDGSVMLHVISITTYTAFFYWFLGGGIRFMLDGHAANGSAPVAPPQETAHGAV